VINFSPAGGWGTAARAARSQRGRPAQEDGRRSAGSRLPPGRLEEWRRGGQRKPVRRRLDWRRRAGDAETARRVCAREVGGRAAASLTDFFFLHIRLLVALLIVIQH
jgi:hypothetical protein